MIELHNATQSLGWRVALVQSEPEIRTRFGITVGAANLPNHGGPCVDCRGCRSEKLIDCHLGDRFITMTCRAGGHDR